MAWTTPRDWTAGEVVTESHMDVHVRDNLQYLKDIQDGVQGQDFLWANGTTGVGGINLGIRKARTSIAAPSIVAAGDELGLIYFQGYDGGGYVNAAGIQAMVDGTPGASDMPGRLIFYTTADGASALTERMRINAAGQVLIPDGTLGLPGLAFLSDPDTGIYRSGTDGLNLVAGGLLCMIAYAVLGGARLGFFGATGSAKPTVTGSRAGNAALASLLTELNTLGLITNSSSA